MGYNATLRKKAEKYLDKQTAAIQLRILDAIDALPKGDVKKLRGRTGLRLVVGDFRVVFRYTNLHDEFGNTIIDVVKIGPRGDVYKKGRR